MRHTVTMMAEHWDQLLAAIFSEEDCEGAAFLLSGTSSTVAEKRCLVREVVPIADDEYLVRESHRLSIDSRAYARVAKRAAATGDSIIFVHSHPNGAPEFSPQDDHEEPKLMEFLGRRAGGAPHGSLVVSGRDSVSGRMWVGAGWAKVARIRVLGSHFRLFDADSPAVLPEVWDRQVAAFGPDLQRALAGVHVGVVGAGGTGSAVAEQLCRLGVGTLSIFDGDNLERTNVTRVYGSRTADAGANKAECLGRHLVSIGLGTQVKTVPQFISVETAAKELRDCDFVFGCTDLEAPRALLVQLSLRYLIPVFDVGVKITSDGGTIRDITGRVTTLFPGNACLFCRGRISPDRIRIEQLAPEERRRLVAEGYAAELHQRDPSVIMFTTAVASQAVMEFVHRLTDFMGRNRLSTEVLPQFHSGHIGKNGEKPGSSCLCSQRNSWGRGDARDFLGVTWTA